MSTKDPLYGIVFSRIFEGPYAMTSRFNDPRNYSAFGGSVNDRHEGADYVPLSSETDNLRDNVLAVYPGRVVVAKQSGGYGKHVYIESSYFSTKFLLVYAHLDSLNVQVGDLLSAGDVIGEVGDTGNSYGEHLHLTLKVPYLGAKGYIARDVVDPEQYFLEHHNAVGVVI